VAGGVPIEHENIMTDGMQEISKTLPDHVSYFHPHHLDNYGLQMLVKKDLSVTESGDVFVYKERGHIPDGDVGTHARNIQYVSIETKQGLITIINFHGLWNGGGKTDSEDRIQQSKNILGFTDKLEGDFVFCGDFNLLPSTKSLKMFEDAGLRNLIKEYDIKSTRTSYYTKPEKHADYVLVSEGVQVKDLRVLPDEVSDHSPLILEFHL